MSNTRALIDALHANIARHDSALVAFSAGIDSTLVLKLAHDVLGDRALGVIGRSPSVPPLELEHAHTLAQEIGARLRVVDTHEMSDPNYASNPNDRCFFCKQELYDVCHQVAAEERVSTILNGTNADDPGDWRPGLRAADLAEVASPLLECGLHKQEVRDVARALGLSNWNKPALACLASRLPHGTQVTPERLQAVDQVEQLLRAKGFRDVRARHLGRTVSLEVDVARTQELRALLDAGALAEVLAQTGFQEAQVAADGYKTGRLNPSS
ncbi:MAG: TIGR00268 family protein [Planctomycetota bacterium]|nr:MAG: TIGR00268 family protein [Planctomycetota bacterium]